MLSSDATSYCQYARHELPRPTVHKSCLDGFQKGFYKVEAFFRENMHLVSHLDLNPIDMPPLSTSSLWSTPQRMMITHTIQLNTDYKEPDPEVIEEEPVREVQETVVQKKVEEPKQQPPPPPPPAPKVEEPHIKQPVETPKKEEEQQVKKEEPTEEVKGRRGPSVHIHTSSDIEVTGKKGATFETKHQTDLDIGGSSVEEEAAAAVAPEEHHSVLEAAMDAIKSVMHHEQHHEVKQEVDDEKEALVEEEDEVGDEDDMEMEDVSTTCMSPC